MSFISNSDISTDIAQRSLEGLWQAQNIASANIANVEPPGYKVRQFDFDSYMDDALDALNNGETIDKNAYVSTDRSTSLRVDGSNVDLEQQTIAVMQNAMRYQTVMSQLGRKFELLNSIVRDA